MKKKILIALILMALLIGGVSVMTSVQRSKSRNALTAYKAELRAQGEKLTYEEAGYPYPLETNAALEKFILLSDRLVSISQIPARITYGAQPSKPGSAMVTWAAAELYDGATNVGGATWEDLARDCAAAAPTLAEIRAELEHPPLRFIWNSTNPLSFTPRNPFIQKRKTAQFLAADSLSALHEQQPARARTNLHTLTQLLQVHRYDFTLVNAMIRVAISGLALTITWEALVADGWDEDSLVLLQGDWEGIDLAEALETGFVGERIFGEYNFKRIRELESAQQRGMLMLQAPSPIRSFSDLGETIQSSVAMAYWRNHIEEDEMFYLQHMESQIETARKLKGNAGGTALMTGIVERQTEFERMIASPLWKYRHLVSAIALPNFERVSGTVIQNETQRRMTITVIALKRFHLRNGHYPTALGELVPQFVAAELIDPWSGKPFGYRLDADGAFTLYSVGEDGIDNGGDPTLGADTKAPAGMWAGKDAVWPTPVFPVAPPLRSTGD